jgi:dUTP pyrophosphatase
MLKIKIKAISNQFLPSYQTLLAAGMDLMAAIDEPISILPGERKLVGTGISIALPPGFEAQIRSRSGIAFKNGVCVLNSPGTIDADYRGEIKVLLINHGQEPFLIHTGDRIAQMVIAKHERIEWETVIELDETERGIGGYGSTGIQNSN